MEVARRREIEVVEVGVPLGRSYRLRVPPNAPMKLFWSVTLYDVSTRSLLVNKQKIADRSSRMPLQANKDGSIDVYCSPKAPPGLESNWIPTVRGKSWFAYFRLYEPTQAYFDRTRPLGDFVVEKMQFSLRVCRPSAILSTPVATPKSSWSPATAACRRLSKR